MRLSYWLGRFYARLGISTTRSRLKGRRRPLTAASQIESLEDRWLLANWSGDIPDGTVWPAGQVQRITGSVNIPAGSTLTIQPGAVVKFNAFNMHFTVSGTLLAQGTGPSPIVFTELRDDTGGDTNGDGSASGPVSGNWGRIEFTSTSTASILDHVDVRYGGFDSAAEILVNGGQLTLTNSVVRNSSVAGIRVQTSNPTLTGNTYQNNSGAAVSMDLASNPAISGVTVTNNAVNGLVLDTGTLVGNRQWNDPEIVYWLTGDITVPQGNSLAIAAGQVIKRPFFGDLFVNGSLTANGTSVAPIVFTELRDDTAGGDTNNNGNGDSPANGNSGAIRFSNTSSGNVLDHVEVRYGGFDNVAAVIVDAAPLSFTNGTIRNSNAAGLRIQSSNPTITNNAFSNNATGAISMDLASNPAISGNTLTNNGVNGLVLDTGTLTANGVWNDPDIVYWFTSDITVPAGLSLTIAAGQVIKRPFFGDLFINGSLTANGTEVAPVIFTEHRDDAAGGDTNNNANGNVPSNGNAGVVLFSATSTSNLLDHVEFRYGGFDNVASVVVNAAPLTMTSSVIRNSNTTGLRIQSSNPTVTNNAFTNNAGAAISMDLASNPAVSGNTLTNNGVNGLALDTGILTVNGVWNDPDIVYWFTSDITVPAGLSLTIAAGQVIKRPFFGDLFINGSLTANGTEVAPVIFTEQRDDAAGGDTNNNASGSVPSNGNAGVVLFSATSTSNVLDHVEFRYGGFDNVASVVVNAAPLTMTNSVIRNSNTTGLRIQSSNPTVTGNTIQNNSGAALSMDLASNPAISGNTLGGNLVNGLALDSGSLVVDGVWNDPDIVYWLTSDITVPQGKTLTIEPGQVIKRPFFGDLFVDGSLVANGVSAAPIIITEHRDDTAGGDTNNDGAGSGPAGGNAGRIVFSNTSSGNVMDHAEVRYAGFGGTAALLVDGASLSFTNGVIRNTSTNALQARTGAMLDVRNSVIANNADAGIRAESGATVTAINNTIDGNVRGVTVDGNGTVLELTNNLITHNSVVGVNVANRGILEASYNDVFNPGSSFGNYNGTPNATGADGNISADPKYVNRAAFDFHLQSTSPAIDAATSEEAPIDDRDFNFRVDTLAVTNTGAGDSPFFDMGAYEFGAPPRAVKHSPSGNVADVVSKLLFTFRGAMDATTFSPAADVISFSGPNGPVTVTDYRWLNKYQLEVSFNAQAQAGDYEFVIGPNILDVNGNALDTDADGTRGESTDDRYSATWKIVPPRVVRQSPRDFAPAPLDHLDLTFDRPMDPQSFSLADIVSFTGPSGNVSATGFNWTDSRTLRITFDSQATLGMYEMVLGPEIKDVGGNLLDQNRNGIAGEVPVDRRVAAFTLAEVFHVSGNITQNTTWNGLVIVDANVTVQAGVTLTISPGTIVKLSDLTTLFVQSGATLLSNGTTAQPVRITSIHDDTIGGDTDQNDDRIAPQPGDWISLQIDGGTANLESTHIRYGGGSASGSWNQSGMFRTTGSATLNISRSILSDAFFDGVLTQGGTTTITNTIISGADRGVVSWLSGAQVVVTNSTIVDNRIGLLGHGGTLNVVNSIVSHNLQFGIDNDIDPDPTVSFTDIFTPGATNTRGFPNPLGANGNMSVDPEFVNLEGGNYRLGFASRVIDAANGAAAPATDHVGAPRYDDPRTANTGTIAGNGTFADMGAFEFVEGAPSNLDLLVTAVGGPSAATQGETIIAQWSVKNIGTEVAGGTWHDAIYLSADTVWTPDDVLLADVLHSGDLGPNQSYSASTEVRVPGLQPGTYHFLVRANSDDALFEGQNRANNVTASTSTASIDLPALDLGTPVTGHLEEAGESLLYKIVAPPDSDIRVTLDGPDGAVNELYVKFGEIPTRQSFDARGILPTQPDQTVSFGTVTGGTYYVRVYTSSAPLGETFTLTASLATFSIASVFPTAGSNAGQVTLTISGTDFDANSQPRLIDSASNPIVPTRIYFTDSGQLSATFDLTGHPTGLASVQIINTGNVTTTLPQAFNVFAGQPGRLATNVVAPSAVRVGRGYVVYVEYSNTGDADLLAPVMRLQNSGSSLISLRSDMTDAASSVDLIGVGASIPAGILSPGASGRIPVYVAASGSGTDSFELIIGEYPATPIDWDAMNSVIRPDDITDEEWNPLYARLQQNIGNTWQDFHQAISVDASLLQAEQGLNFSLNDVLQLEINKAFAELSTSVSGQLFLGDTSHPLGNVNITLYDPDTQVASTAVSFADGTFLVPFVSTGTYQITVEGYSITTADEVTVDTTDVNGLNVVVTAAAMVSGRVVRDTSGVPLADVLVSAGNGDGQVFTTTTNTSGDYTLTGLPAGIYSIQAGGEAFTHAVVTDVELSAGQVRSPLNFAIDTGATLRGLVTGPGGAVSGAQVVATRDDGLVFVADTDATGEYEITEILGGTYIVSANASGLSAGVANNVNVATGATVAGVNLALLPAGTVEGTTTLLSNGSIVTMVGIQLTGAGGTFFTQSDTNGHFSLATLPAGSYTLNTQGGDFLGGTINVDVVAGSTTVVPVSISAKGNIAGQVTAIGSGVGVAGVTVHALLADGSPLSAVTDVDGAYSITGFDAGTYTVILGQPGTPGLARTSATISAVLPSATSNFSISVAGVVSGTVFGSNGTTAMPGAFVALVQAGTILQRMPTDDTGHYSFVVVSSGIYELLASADGVAFPVRTNVNISAGLSQSNLNFTAGTDAVQGTVLNALNGLPIGGASVDVVRTVSGLPGLSVASLTTAADGTFQLTGIVPGTYQITARSPNSAATRQTVIVSSGVTANANFQLGADTTVRGMVRDDATNLPVQNAVITLAGVGGTTGAAIAITNEAGQYEIDGISAGTYDLTVVSPGYEANVIPGILTSAVDQVVDVDLQVAAIHLRGTVTNGSNPLGGVTVTATSTGGTVLGFAITAIDGTFEIDTLVAGDYTLTATGLGYRTSTPQPMTLTAGATVNGLSFSLSAVAIIDPTPNAAPGSDLGLRDTINRMLNRATRRTDHPDRITDLLPFVVPGECVDQTRAALSAIRMADAKLDDFQRVASVAEGYGERALETVALVGLRGAQFVGLIAQLQATIMLYSTELTGFAGLQVGVLNGILNAGNNYIITQTQAENNAKSGLPGASVSSALGAVGLATNINFAAAGLLAKFTAEAPESALGASNLAVGVRSIVATLSLIVTSTRLLITSYEDLIRVFRSFEQFNNAATLYDKAVDNAKQAIAVVKSCNCHRDSAEVTASATECRKPPEPKKPIGPPVRPGQPKPPNAPPDSKTGATTNTDKKQSNDPNHKTGPAGFGEEGFIQLVSMPFKIEFENSAATGATAAAQIVVVTDTMDSDFDPESLEFTGFGFGPFSFEVPAGLSHYETTLDLRPDDIDLLVPVTLDFNATTRILTATFESLDPLTGMPPDDPDAGFLPVNDATHIGEGFFTYSIRPQNGLITGTALDNQASIVFDTNDAILTPTTHNRLDVGGPSSSVATIASLSSARFLVAWSGNDDTNGSGIGTYDIYVSDNNGDYTLWQSATSETSATFTGEAEHTYRFYSVSRDNVGHQEEPPLVADASTTVETNIAPSIPSGQSFNIAGNAANEAAVGTVTATDPNVTSPNNTKTFGISSGNGAGAFAINPTTGLITVANATALTTLAGTTASLEITVIDGGLPVLSATQTVNVVVANVNTAPVLATPGSAPTYVGSLKTPVLVLPSITVTDADGASTLERVVITLPFAGKKKALDIISLPGVASIGDRIDGINGGMYTITVFVFEGVTNAAVQAMLRGMTFSTKGAGLKMTNRNFQVRVTDRTGLQSNLVTQNVGVRKK